MHQRQVVADQLRTTNPLNLNLFAGLLGLSSMLLMHQANDVPISCVCVLDSLQANLPTNVHACILDTGPSEAKITNIP